jgi:hypothetical protein
MSNGALLLRNVNFSKCSQTNGAAIVEYTGDNTANDHIPVFFSKNYVFMLGILPNPHMDLE